MKRKKLIKKVRSWMNDIGIDGLRDMDCSAINPENCPTHELRQVCEDIEEDEAKAQQEAEQYAQALEESDSQDLTEL